MPIIQADGDILKAPEEYLVLLCNCIEKKLQPEDEPILARIYKRYPHADLYFDRRSHGKKGKPGSILLKGDGDGERSVINIQSHFYKEVNNFPNDSAEKRLDWFKKGLNEIIKLRGLQSLAFSREMLFAETKSSEYLEKYLNAIGDLEKMIRLKQRKCLKIVIYSHSPDQPGRIETQSETSGKIIPFDRLFQLEIVSDFKSAMETEVNREGNSGLEEESEVKQLSVASPSAASPTPAPTKQKIQIQPKLRKINPNPRKNTRPNVDENNTPQLATLPPVKEVSVSESPETALTQVYPGWDENPDWKYRLSDIVRNLSGWESVFGDPHIRAELQKIDTFFQEEMKRFGDFTPICPPQDQIFRAFSDLPLSQVKVVILGQDPYPGEGEAMGLAFGVNPGIKIPPSLQNIFKELQTDISGFQIPKSGDLSPWAQRGVLLLNTSLSVRQHKKESHMKIWRDFTDRVIELLSEKSPNKLVFLLWGLHAQRKQNLIVGDRHHILKSVHPSPLSANRGGWFGEGLFSKTNQLLEREGLNPIDWSL